MIQRENHELRPKVLAALGTIPEWRGCVIPVEKLAKQAAGRKRPPWEIPSGSPDIWGTVSWESSNKEEIGAQLVCLEMKTPSGRMTPAQEMEFPRLVARGVHMYIVHSPEEAVSYIELTKRSLRRAGLVPCSPPLRTKETDYESRR